MSLKSVHLACALTRAQVSVPGKSLQALTLRSLSIRNTASVAATPPRAAVIFVCKQGEHMQLFPVFRGGSGPPGAGQNVPAPPSWSVRAWGLASFLDRSCVGASLHADKAA